MAARARPHASLHPIGGAGVVGGTPTLLRALGRWSLAALVVNSIIGSGIFGLPRDIVRLVGDAAPLVCLVAAAGIGVIVACFAEVSSQFDAAGGPYLWVRETLGRFAGIQTGWLALLVRLTSAAANANLFVIYVAQFWPAATTRLPRVVLLTLLIGMLAAVNLRGVTAGAGLSNVFTVAKLVPLALFIGFGVPHMGDVDLSLGTASTDAWLQALLALVFAYGGFEAALIPLGEAKNPRRDAPFALFVALGVVAVVYTLVHVVVVGVAADPGSASLADTARAMLGPAGAIGISIGALISMYGYLAGQMVSGPRLPYALAENGDFPRILARIHKRFRTPHASIALYAVSVWLLAIYGTFLWNAILSAVARLFTYALVCAALVVLRRTRPGADAFRVPGGPWLAAAGIGFCLLLVSRMGRGELLVLLATAVLGLVTWWRGRGRGA